MKFVTLVHQKNISKGWNLTPKRRVWVFQSYLLRICLWVFPNTWAPNMEQKGHGLNHLGCFCQVKLASLSSAAVCNSCSAFHPPKNNYINGRKKYQSARSSYMKVVFSMYFFVLKKQKQTTEKHVSFSKAHVLMRLPSWRLTWNIIMEVCFFFLLNGWFVGSMLIFQGVKSSSKGQLYRL